jgi:hypothetical protein
LRTFLKAVDWEGGGRCEGCYRLRLQKTADLAAAEAFDAFSTTLLSSQHQHHEMVRRLGNQCAAEAGVEFLYRDWRDLAEKSHEEARSMNLYLQQYCGCVFSEYDRYKDTKKHLYRGAGNQDSD